MFAIRPTTSNAQSAELYNQQHNARQNIALRKSHLAQDLWTKAMDDDSNDTDNAGMRHSIRPRRAVAIRDSQEVIDITPSANRPVAPKQLFQSAPSLTRWHDLAMVEPGLGTAPGMSLPAVDEDRDSPSVRAFDLLRTRLRQTTQEHGWKNIGITSPTPGCGTTFMAANLALSLSRISGSRTILMDLNMRKPGIAKALNMPTHGAMSDFLNGHAAIGDHMVKTSETLALGLNNAADFDPSETLQAAQAAQTLELMRTALDPELVLYDLPAMLAYDDVSAFLPQLDGILLVSDGTQTMASQLAECERMLEGQVPLLGVVLNRARKDSIARYN